MPHRARATTSHSGSDPAAPVGFATAVRHQGELPGSSSTVRHGIDRPSDRRTVGKAEATFSARGGTIVALASSMLRAVATLRAASWSGVPSTSVAPRRSPSPSMSAADRTRRPGPARESAYTDSGRVLDAGANRRRRWRRCRDRGRGVSRRIRDEENADGLAPQPCRGRSRPAALCRSLRHHAAKDLRCARPSPTLGQCTWN